MHEVSDKGGAALAHCTTRVGPRYLFEETPIWSAVPRKRLLALGSQGTNMQLDFQPEGSILLGAEQTS